MNSLRAILLLSAVVAAALSNAGTPSPASAAPGGQTFVLTSTLDASDVTPGDGVCADAASECTLRAAIIEANALPGHQTVMLPAGEYVLTRDGFEENESDRGDLDILDDLSIVGVGANQTGVTEEAFAVDRIFDVRAGTVSIRDLTVHGVFMSAILSGDETCGGGIRNSSDLTVSRVVIRDNTFRRGGGGICNQGGVLRLSDSGLHGNVAALLGPGGGVFNASGLAVLERLTIYDNSGHTTGGGGIANGGVMIVRDSLVLENGTDGEGGGSGILNFGSLTAINVTVSANRADALGPTGGGGISNRNEGRLTLINSTVVGNEASHQSGGGIFTQEGSTTNLINTIVANNVNFDCQSSPTSTSPVSLGHNLDSDGSCQLSGPGDLSGVDPLLGDLADNGGPTMTHALLPGSPAIHAGDDAECPAADQRGAPRPAGAACDIGAYEAGSDPPAPGPLPGDVDCDGALSPFDQLALMQHLGSLATPDCIEQGDMDCDGDVDTVDAVALLRRLAGILDPPCTPV